MNRIFTIDFLVVLAVLCAASVFAWWRDRVTDRKLGKTHALMIRNKFKKYFPYRHLLFFCHIVVMTSVLIGLHILFEEDDSRNNPLTVPLAILISQIFARFRPLTFGENGIILGDSMFSFGRAGQFIPWDKIRDVEWDRDIGQIGWGFKVYFKNGAAPFKASVEREYQPDANKLFKRFLKTENVHEEMSV